MASRALPQGDGGELGEPDDDSHSSDSQGGSDIEPEDLGQAPLPLTNPPPLHKLSTHKYDSLPDLMADLQEYCARVLRSRQASIRQLHQGLRAHQG